MLVAATEADLLAARLTRIKNLLGDLEQASVSNSANLSTFRKLKAELDAARASLEIVHPPSFPNARS